MFLYAYSADQGLAGFTAVSADSDHGKVTISKAASIIGRMIDTSGNPRRGIGLEFGWPAARSTALQASSASRSFVTNRATSVSRVLPQDREGSCPLP